MGHQSVNDHLRRLCKDKLMSKKKIHNEPGRCINCDCRIKKGELQCWWDKRNNPIKKKNKKQ